MSDDLDRLYERMLIARCQAGDTSAFAELVNRYQPRLLYFVRKLRGNAQPADDLLQDVWLDVFRSLRKLRDPAAFPAWVYRIARDRVYREMRRTRQSVELDATAESAIPAAEQDEEFTEEDAQFVHECLDELSAEHREALVLRFLDALSYEDIADVVGCSVGTVRSRLHYAKLALRVAIERKRRDE